MLKIAILSLNFSEMGNFQLQISYFRKKNFDRLKVKGVNCPLPLATTPLVPEDPQISYIRLSDIIVCCVPLAQFTVTHMLHCYTVFVLHIRAFLRLI